MKVILTHFPWTALAFCGEGAPLNSPSFLSAYPPSSYVALAADLF